MTAYYNELDPFAAQWLRNLIAAGYIAPGDVDERDIRDVQADDLVGYDQCHFFAGIGAWSYALRLAGWPDDKPVWTGSCPCQPFSCAGKGKAFDDVRHLWPEWYRLIRECRPAILFGEQVDAAVRWGWLDLVQSDLEAAGYACGAATLPAACVGAPHIRHRLWFVGKRADELADAVRIGRGRRSEGNQTGERGEIQATGLCRAGRLADPSNIGQHGRRTSETGNGRDEAREQPAGFHTACGVADAPGKQEYEEQPEPTTDEGKRKAGLPCGCGLLGFMDNEGRPGLMGSQSLGMGVLLQGAGGEKMKALFQLPDKPDILEVDEIIRLTGRTIASAQCRWLEDHKWLFEVNRAGEPIVSRLYFQMKLSGIDAGAFLPQKAWEPDFNSLS